MSRGLLVVAILAIAASTALAHGGRYTPPNGEVPPNMRRPEDPPPPDDDPTPTPPPEEAGGTETPPDAPGNGGRGGPPPEDPGGSTNPPKGGLPGAGGSDRGGGAATPPGRRRAAAPSLTYDSWEFWWSYNDDDVLNLRSRLRERDRVTGTVSDPLGLGRGHRGGGSARLAPTDVAIRERIVPALERVIDSDLHFDIRSGAVLALAKVGSTREGLHGRIAIRLLRVLLNEGRREHPSVEESAALALGLLQVRDAIVVDVLRDTMLDRSGERRSRTRAFAALALGFLRVRSEDVAYESVVRALRDVVGSSDEPLDDVPACALFAMGLSGDVALVPDLVAMIQSGRAYRTRPLGDLLRSYAASALGKIAEESPAAGTPEVADALTRAVIGPGRHTPRSAVIALGQVGKRPDLPADLRREMVRVLAYVVRKGESQAAYFAAISLGRIGGATDDAAVRALVHEILVRLVVRGDRAARPFGALALGLFAPGGDAHPSIREALRAAFRERRGDPRDRGAYAIALGMVRDRVSVSALTTVLEDRGAFKPLRGACAVALGLIRDREASDAVKAALLENRDPALRASTAVAAGLIGRSDVVPALIDLLRDPRSGLYVQGSVTLALGRIGDARAIDPLLEMLEDGRAQDLSRALAAVALGLLGDDRDLPLLGRLSRDVNYRAQVNAITEVLTIL